MTTAIDRNLLLGLLALQNGIINQGQLVHAFQAWTLDKSKSLAEHLEARGDLTVAGRVLLDVLCEVHLEAPVADRFNDRQRAIKLSILNEGFKHGLDSFGEVRYLVRFHGSPRRSPGIRRVAERNGDLRVHPLEIAPQRDVTADEQPEETPKLHPGSQPNTNRTHPGEIRTVTRVDYESVDPTCRPRRQVSNRVYVAAACTTSEQECPYRHRAMAAGEPDPKHADRGDGNCTQQKRLGSQQRPTEEYNRGCREQAGDDKGDCGNFVHGRSLPSRLELTGWDATHTSWKREPDSEPTVSNGVEVVKLMPSGLRAQSQMLYFCARHARFELLKMFLRNSRIERSQG